MNKKYLELDRIISKTNGIFTVSNNTDIDMLRLRNECKGDYSKLTEAKILSYARKPKTHIVY